jgi:hypothetical protein
MTFHRTLLCALICLWLISSWDLFAPPISQTVWRQTQTSELSRSFAQSGFSFDGLTLPVAGPDRVSLVYEFPLYNFLQGALHGLGIEVAFAGKLISLMCASVTLALVMRWVWIRHGRNAAIAAGLFFIFSPVSVLMHTSAQPDTLCVALLALATMLLFDQIRTSWSFSLAMLCGAIAAVVKFPSVIPWLPVFGVGVFYTKGRFQAPRAVEWLAILAGAALFLSWHWFREQNFEDTLQSKETIRAMFLFGDLGRFFRANYYLKPAITYTIFLGGGIGMLLLASGLVRRHWPAVLVVSGSALYYIVVPTVADQYYYLYPLAPLLAVVVGHEWPKGKLVAPAYTLAAACLALGLFFIYPYVLRRDEVTYHAALTFKDVSSKNDLVLFAPNHDRVIGRGSFNPTFFFFSERRGWISGARDMNEIKRDAVARGARFIVATTYTPDLEVWWSRLLPRAFRNDPGLVLFGDTLETPGLKLHARSANWLIAEIE